MKMPEVSLLEWQKRFGTEHACEKVLVTIRWPNGFICPRCNSKDASFIIPRKNISVPTAGIKFLQWLAHCFIRHMCLW